jgi:hypothetical protein
MASDTIYLHCGECAGCWQAKLANGADDGCPWCRMAARDAEIARLELLCDYAVRVMHASRAIGFFDADKFRALADVSNRFRQQQAKQAVDHLREEGRDDAH